METVGRPEALDEVIEAVKSAFGGVLFIDEASALFLFPEGPRCFYRGYFPKS